MSTQSRHRRHRDDESMDALSLEATDDRMACDRLLARLRPELARLSESLMGHDTCADPPDDDVDDLCRAVVRALPTYRAEHEDFWAFAFTVAYRARSGGLSGEDRAREAQLAEILDGLPKEQRSVLLLRVQGRLSVPATARLLGSTAAAVRIVQHRALRELQQAWSRSAQPYKDANSPRSSRSTTHTVESETRGEHQ